MFKPTALVCAALLVSGTRFATDYSTERSYKVSFVSSLAMETTSSSMEVDGEPVERPGGGGGSSSKSERSGVWVDTVLEAAEGQASVLTRAFEELSGSSSSSFGGEENSREFAPQLAGVTLKLTRGEQGELEVEVAEGRAPEDDACLEGHQIELALDALLPLDEVEADVHWDLDSRSVRRALGLDLERALFPRPVPTEGGGGRGPGSGGRSGGGDSRVLEQAEWRGKATLSAEEVEHDGELCRVIELELKASGELAEAGPSAGGGRRGGGVWGLEPAERLLGTSYSIELQGQLFFSLAQRCPVALEIEGSVAQEVDTERPMRDSTLHIRSSKSGTYTLSVTVAKL